MPSRAMAKLICVLGGVRSGKSRHAVALAQQVGLDIAFIATCMPRDEEMKERVRRHQEHRPTQWMTVENRADLPVVLDEISGHVHAAIIDDLTLWVADALDKERSVPAILKEVEELCRAAREVAQDVIIVTHEVGSGVIPPTPLGRQFSDLLGEANQIVAREADEVYAMTAGIPRKIK